MNLTFNQEYWDAQHKLEACKTCSNYCFCWTDEGAVYLRRITKKICTDVEVRKAMEIIERILSMRNEGVDI